MIEIMDGIRAFLRHPLKKQKRQFFRSERKLERAGVRPQTTTALVTYDQRLLHRMTNRIDECFDIAIDETRIPTINVLVPAFDFGSMSAGFFGVFQVALYIKKIGHNVRLVLYDEFSFKPEDARKKLMNYPGMERLLDDLEYVYIGDRKAPLRVSPSDSCVATVWYSAYFAREIMDRCGGGRFLYLVQDYESVFQACGSLFAFSDASYNFDCAALFSSESLQEFFVSRKIGKFYQDVKSYRYFNNACSSKLPDRSTFLKRRSGKKRLVFYCRPPVPRNMFELGALALCRAVERGIFDTNEWEFIGMGLGQAEIVLGRGATMTQMPRMNLKEYLDTVATFDIALCLMASPHPSLMPFDLGGAGAVVVTNSFATKDQSYFDRLIPGIVTCNPDIASVVGSLAKAVQLADELEMRYDNAYAMVFPRSWDETFDKTHEVFLNGVFGQPSPL